MPGGSVLSAEKKAETEASKQIGPVLFVLGSPRSGTTLLSRILLYYFDYGMGPEGHWIVPFAKRLGRFGDLEEPQNLRRLVEAVLSEEMFKIVRERYERAHGWAMDVTPEMVLEALPERSYRGVVYAALLCLTKELRRSRVGNKNPGFTQDLDVLDRLFPTEAKYLCVVRDGRDVTLSMKEQPWGQNSWYANARFWAECCEKIERFRSRMPPERLLLVRYEDLLRDPEGSSRTIEEFLDHRLSDADRARLVEEITQGSRSRNFDKWRDRMKPYHHRLFESAAGKWLEYYAYERVNVTARSYPWERGFFMTLEYGRRAWGRVRTALGFPQTGKPTPTDRPGGL